jgi:hypothetical protein
MEKLYVVVLRNEESFTDHTEMATYSSKDSALSRIGSTFGGETSVSRVFSVNEFGEVTLYQVVFDGQLSLKELPKKETN